MAERRMRRWVKAALVVAVGGGSVLALAASTFSAKNPTTIPTGTTTGQRIATLDLTLTKPGVSSLRMTFSEALGSGTVTLTRAADTGVKPTVQPSLTGSVNTACVMPTTTSLYCPSLSDLAPTVTPPTSVTFTFHGLKVNSTSATGEVEVFAVVSGASTFRRTAVATTYVTTNSKSVTPTTGKIKPVFVPASGIAVNFTVGQHGATWVHVHGPRVYLSLVGAPKWLTIGTHSGYLSGTPPTGAEGTYTFTVVANTTSHPQKHGPNLQAAEKVTLHVVR